MDIRLAKISKDSIVDGAGMRAVIWTQGCPHGCEGCHNQTSHDFNSGYIVDTDEVVKKIADMKLIRGVTFSGGEPFCQAAACGDIARELRSIGLDIWVYTGYILKNPWELSDVFQPQSEMLLKHTDVLVDGPFILSKRNLMLRFRGSDNQRVVDIRKSRQENKIVLYPVD